MSETVDVAREEGSPREHLRSVADAFAEIGRQIEAGPGAAAESLVNVTAARVPGAECVSVTTLRRGRFETTAATSPLARDADSIQYDVGSGPCVDAALDASTYRTGDVQHDERWPEFGQRVSSLGVRSMLAFRLHLERDDTVAALNLYSREVDAFDDDAMMMGLLLATHGAVAFKAVASSRQADELTKALQSSRMIGTAVGILMATHLLSQQQAFDLMSVASQNSNRRLADIAADVVGQGSLGSVLDLRRD